jgi:hypothetical protein
MPTLILDLWDISVVLVVMKKGTRRMEKGPIGTRRMEKGSSGNFYGELEASRMSNYRSHRYTSDGESTMWRSMIKPFVTDQILFVIDV